MQFAIANLPRSHNVEILIESAPWQEQTAREAGVPIITCDEQITRRNRAHLIDWPTDRPAYATQSLIDAIETIWQSGFKSALLTGGDSRKTCIRITLAERHTAV